MSMWDLVMQLVIGIKVRVRLDCLHRFPRTSKRTKAVRLALLCHAERQVRTKQKREALHERSRLLTPLSDWYLLDREACSAVTMTMLTSFPT